MYKYISINTIKSNAMKSEANAHALRHTHTHGPLHAYILSPSHKMVFNFWQHIVKCNTWKTTNKYSNLYKEISFQQELFPLTFYVVVRIMTIDILIHLRVEDVVNIYSY